MGSFPRIHLLELSFSNVLPSWEPLPRRKLSGSSASISMVCVFSNILLLVYTIITLCVMGNSSLMTYSFYSKEIFKFAINKLPSVVRSNSFNFTSKIIFVSIEVFFKTSKRFCLVFYRVYLTYLLYSSTVTYKYLAPPRDRTGIGP